MSETYNNFENQMEKQMGFSFENFNPEEEEVYSVFDDYLL